MMYPDVVHVAMGDLLRERVQGTPEQKWLDIMDMMRDGKMAPEVCVIILCVKDGARGLCASSMC